MFEWKCPKCGEVVEFPNPLARELAKRAGACRACRADATLRRLMAKGDMVNAMILVDWFERAGLAKLESSNA